MIASQINIRLLVAKMNSFFQYSTNAPRVYIDSKTTQILLGNYLKPADLSLTLEVEST
jgi:hypothetical protein